MNFTFWAVSLYFFRNVHVNHDQLPIKETHQFLYFMTYKAKSSGFYGTKLYSYGVLFFPSNGFWGFINSGKAFNASA